MTACPVMWCRLDADHDELHEDHVLAVLGQHRASVALTVEAASNDVEPLPVLSAGNGAVARVVLDWETLHQLATAMLRAHRRHRQETNT